MKVVVLTTSYPTPSNPVAGNFVAASVEALSTTMTSNRAPWSWSKSERKHCLRSDSQFQFAMQTETSMGSAGARGAAGGS